MPTLTSKELIISLIGFVGVLVTALFSNWDKLFPPKNEIKTTFSGYRSTGVFETELRYYFEVSGARKMMENMGLQLLVNFKISLIQQYPDDTERIDAFFKAAADELPRLDNIIQKLMPVYHNYFSIEELQELNKFYSTEIMQNMLRKNNALIIEAAPLQVEIMQDYNDKVKQIAQNIFINHSDEEANKQGDRQN